MRHALGKPQLNRVASIQSSRKRYPEANIVWPMWYVRFRYGYHKVWSEIKLRTLKSVFCAVSIEGYQTASFLLHRRVFAIQRKQTIKLDKTNHILLPAKLARADVHEMWVLARTLPWNWTDCCSMMGYGALLASGYRMWVWCILHYF
jgi:hypothetical protein